MTPGEAGTVRQVSMRDIENWFTYHAPTPHQLPKYQNIRDAAKNLATIILNNVPAGPDQVVAIGKIREAVLMANQAIACDTAG
jgi:hypothetical protein